MFNCAKPRVVSTQPLIFLAVGRGASVLAPWRSSAAVILETPFQPCPKTILAEGKTQFLAKCIIPSLFTEKIKKALVPRVSWAASTPRQKGNTVAVLFFFSFFCKNFSYVVLDVEAALLGLAREPGSRSNPKALPSAFKTKNLRVKSTTKTRGTAAQS